jgi:hypothetical protein
MWFSPRHSLKLFKVSSAFAHPAASAAHQTANYIAKVPALKYPFLQTRFTSGLVMGSVNV